MLGRSSVHSVLEMESNQSGRALLDIPPVNRRGHDSSRGRGRGRGGGQGREQPEYLMNKPERNSSGIPGSGTSAEHPTQSPGGDAQSAYGKKRRIVPQQTQARGHDEGSGQPAAPPTMFLARPLAIGQARPSDPSPEPQQNGRSTSNIQNDGVSQTQSLLMQQQQRPPSLAEFGAGPLSKSGIPVVSPGPLGQISSSFEYRSALASLVLSVTQLEEHAYPIADRTIEELNDKRRCTGCNKYWGKLRRGQEIRLRQEEQDRPRNQHRMSRDEQHAISARGGEHLRDTHSTRDGAKKKGNIDDAESHYNCKFHPGVLEKHYRQKSLKSYPNISQQQAYDRLWSCCKRNPSSEPCSGSKHHKIVEGDIYDLIDQWQVHATPEASPQTQGSHRIAVALDCEMGVSAAGDSELIRLTLIDYFSSQVLIDRLISPDVPMAHLNTRFSGVTWDMMNMARSRRECIHGRDAARREVWRYVGPDTIVVAHSGCNDLASLRWRHGRIVDTFVVEDIKERAKRRAEKQAQEQEEKDRKGRKGTGDHQGALGSEQADDIDATGASDDANEEHLDDRPEMMKAENKPLTGVLRKGPESSQASMEHKRPRRIKGTGPCSLKTLAKTRLGRDIQVGNKGHDSLEDALAARDLAHWLVLRVLDGTLERAAAEKI